METILHSGNFNSFVPVNIYIIQVTLGTLKITNETLYGFTDPKSGVHYDALPVDKLELLSNVTDIKGRLVVTANHPDFKNLTFLRNLIKITGIDSDGRPYNDGALVIRNSSLEFLGLNYLSEIDNGGIVIEGNEKLCIERLPESWQSVFPEKDPSNVKIVNNKPAEECGPCDEQCDENGCWGPGPQKCTECKHFLDQESEACVEKCSTYTVNKVCGSCHPGCVGGCHGPMSWHCRV